VQRLQAAGRLVAKQTAGARPEVELFYGWRRNTAPGRALSWWLQQLESPKTREALLSHRGPAAR
jgi:hypothetical protein